MPLWRAGFENNGMGGPSYCLQLPSGMNAHTRWENPALPRA